MLTLRVLGAVTICGPDGSKVEVSAYRQRTLLFRNRQNGTFKEIGAKLDADLLKKAQDNLKDKVKTAKTKEDVAKALDAKCYAKTFICSTDKEGAECGQELQAFTKGGKVRGELVGEKKVSGKCCVCEKTGVQVYVARQY